MLTKISVRNFKRFDTAEVELGDPVIFIGPNNSGKTSIFQALALWDTGLKKWIEKRGKKTPKIRSGVTINRNSITALPVPFANLLWHELHLREAQRITGNPNILIDIIVEGVTNNKLWICGFEFDYANEEFFYCRPLKLSDKRNPERMEIPDEVDTIRIAYLPPMSGLTTNELRLDQGAINVRIGEGRTAEVLRNLCYIISTEFPQNKSLKEIGFEHYYQAEQKKWVLYLEGSTDLAFLKEFAKFLDHYEAKNILERPYVYYVGNKTSEVTSRAFPK